MKMSQLLTEFASNKQFTNPYQLASFNMSYSIIESANSQQTLADRVQRVFAKTPGPEQLEAIRTLIIDRKDLILIAKTGFGKSLVFNSVPFLPER